jgi:hypothetical protein
MVSKISISRLFSLGVLSTLLFAGSLATPAAAEGRDFGRSSFVSSSYARGYRDGFRTGYRDGRSDAWSSRRDGRSRSLRRVDPRDAYDRGFAAAYERGYRQGFDSVRRRGRDRDRDDHDGHRH